ncbi:MAP3K12-binding inhibitory protein 1 isoform X7 [Artibeus jamaicensis]|uniref:MAP3K12-binding inhibitory protein 1 isoform X7 n=1 Tax=Artibeus jamaicensis TaxID=9417 RepID=UPI00235B080F|nr:MAP3K12-binding inhibitory protein 1 isoform X7 [Artibeus jamaicensis]
MAAVAELSLPCAGDRSLEQSCSPNLSQEVLFEIFRSLHTLAGQLNLRDDVVKITIDWNKLQSLSAFQPALLFSALEQHVLYLQIDRRISAFIERKQAEINENNVREFCNVIDCNQENSCARTDAVFTPYPGFKSHVKVSRVVNTYGPQTRPEGVQGSGHTPSMLRDCGNQAVEERLQNIEAHLRLQTGKKVYGWSSLTKERGRRFRWVRVIILNSMIYIFNLSHISGLPKLSINFAIIGPLPRLFFKTILSLLTPHWCGYPLLFSLIALGTLVSSTR